MCRNIKSYQESLSVGVVQTTVDCNLAWQNSPKMTLSQDEHVWVEILEALRAFQNDNKKPQVILLPELSLPRTRLDDFEKLVASLNIIAIAGADFRMNCESNYVSNEGILFIPRNFFKNHPSRYCTRIIFGKSYPAPNEKLRLNQFVPPLSFKGDRNVYIFDCEQYGLFGVSICYDFTDIERVLMYRGKIHHLFVLAYNRDLRMFRSLADTLCRTIFCNVVVCNTGYYGGSLAVSPYYEAYRQVLFTHSGGNLYTTQVLQLPVRSFVQAQRGEIIEERAIKKTRLFKNPPPGFISS